MGGTVEGWSGVECNEGCGRKVPDGAVAAHRTVPKAAGAPSAGSASEVAPLPPPALSWLESPSMAEAAPPAAPAPPPPPTAAPASAPATSSAPPPPPPADCGGPSTEATFSTTSAFARASARLADAAASWVCSSSTCACQEVGAPRDRGLPTVVQVVLGNVRTECARGVC